MAEGARRPEWREWIRQQRLRWLSFAFLSGNASGASLLDC